jgi:glycosyltransferase involved in cell wall biosynthesis
MPVIDIIIPVYNKYPSLKELLDILLSRQDLYDKIILVDDCSVDRSADIINSYQKTYPDKIISFFQEKNTGPHYARMKGAELSDREYMMFMDADDLINLKGLEHFLQIDTDCGNYGIYYGKTLRTRTNNVTVNDNSTGLKYREIKRPVELLYRTYPTMSGIIVRKDTVSLMSVGRCEWGEDMLFFVRALMQSPFLFFNETVGIYRIAADSRGNSSGSFARRCQYIKTLSSVLRTSQSFSVSNCIFFAVIAVRAVVAWSIKQIKIQWKRVNLLHG